MQEPRATNCPLCGPPFQLHPLFRLGIVTGVVLGRPCRDLLLSSITITTTTTTSNTQARHGFPD